MIDAHAPQLGGGGAKRVGGRIRIPSQRLGLDIADRRHHFRARRERIFVGVELHDTIAYAGLLAGRVAVHVAHGLSDKLRSHGNILTAKSWDAKGQRVINHEVTKSRRARSGSRSSHTSLLTKHSIKDCRFAEYHQL